MLKIVVCDSGWGGELVADFLSEELGMVEIVRVIDWAHAPYHTKDRAMIERLVEAALTRYLDQVDLIVLGGYGTSLALDYLCQKYPKQHFVSMDYSLPYILHTRNYPQQIGVLAGKQTLASELFARLRASLPQSTFITAEHPTWEKLIDDGELENEQIQADLAPYFQLTGGPSPTSLRRLAQQKRSLPLAQTLKPQQADHRSASTLAAAPDPSLEPQSVDALLILDTHFWEIKSELERLFGWRVRVLDFRRKLLHDVCAALGLRGVDGGRGCH